MVIMEATGDKGIGWRGPLDEQAKYDYDTRNAPKDKGRGWGQLEALHSEPRPAGGAHGPSVCPEWLTGRSKSHSMANQRGDPGPGPHNETSPEP